MSLIILKKGPLVLAMAELELAQPAFQQDREREREVDR